MLKGFCPRNAEFGRPVAQKFGDWFGGIPFRIRR
jgi:hypothetical protein